jgi:Ran GTPase-activating protein (RanGAP) involved in mRNA processing and transport
VSVEGILVICEKLNGNQTIQELNVADARLESFSVKALAEVLPTMTALTSINVSHNNLTFGGTKSSKDQADMSGVVALSNALRKCSELSSFTFSGDPYYENYQMNDAPPVTLDVHMAEADVSNKHLGISGAIMAASFCTKMRALKKLDISSNELTVLERNFLMNRVSKTSMDGVDAFVDTLPQCPTLTSVNFSANGVGDDGVEKLAAVVSNSVSLDLSQNEAPEIEPAIDMTKYCHEIDMTKKIENYRQGEFVGSSLLDAVAQLDGTRGGTGQGGFAGLGLFDAVAQLDANAEDYGQGGFAGSSLAAAAAQLNGTRGGTGQGGFAGSSLAAAAAQLNGTRGGTGQSGFAGSNLSSAAASAQWNDTAEDYRQGRFVSSSLAPAPAPAKCTRINFGS